MPFTTTEKGVSASSRNKEIATWILKDMLLDGIGDSTLIRHKRFIDGRYEDWGEFFEGIPDYKRDMWDYLSEGFRKFFEFNFKEAGTGK